MEIKVAYLDDNVFDIEELKSVLRIGLDNLRFEVKSGTNISEFLKLLEDWSPDVALLDIQIKDGDKVASGIDYVDIVRKCCKRAAIVMRSNLDDHAHVSKAIRSGADDFISKNVGGGELCLRLQQVHQICTMKGAVSKGEVGQTKVVGNTMTTVAKRMRRLIESDVNSVLVMGESGTGKEVVADILRSILPPNAPFVTINCGAISPTLLESELFGHVKGAFTGALTDRRGLFETAHGGWVFLDEVNSLSQHAQVALLRLIENNELLRVGSSTVKKINVRILAATNENLEKLVSVDRFRKDLWQRLREVEIRLPPLRDRKDEINDLIDLFCKSMGRGYTITEPARMLLRANDWRSGNIRELRNCLRAMTEYAVDGVLTPLSIPERVIHNTEEAHDEVSSSGSQANDGSINFPVVLGETVNFDAVCDRLLLELTKNLVNKTGKVSLRYLSKYLTVPKTTLSARLRSLVDQGLIDLQDLSRHVSIKID